MCIPHGATSTKDNGYIKIKSKRHIQKVSKEQFLKGDPNFLDERKPTPKEKKHSFFRDLFK